MHLELDTGTLDLDTGRFTLSDGGQRQLTDQERALMAWLAARPHEDVPRQVLLEQVMGYAPSVVSRAVDHAVKRIRVKLERTPARPLHVVSVPGTGYRFVPLVSSSTPTLTLGALEVDLERLELRAPGQAPVSLSATEGRMLELLRAHSGRPVPVEDLLREVWGVRDTSQRKRVVRAVYRLRTKLEEDPKAPRYLQTIRGRGLALTLPDPPPAIEAPAGPAPPSEQVGVRWTCAPPPTEVLGRDMDRQRVEQALQPSGALVSLLGAGGMGKTTLARWVGCHWPGACSFVDLTTVTGPRSLQEALAATHGVDLPREGAPDPMAHALAHAEQVLVVLDNAESCVPALQDALPALQRVAPQARFLVTSREPLRVPREHILRLNGLAPEHASALFSLRAQRAGVSEPVDPAQLLELTTSLHSMPLAIELAAARAPLVGMQGLLKRLDDPLRLLRSAGTHAPRHASLRNVLELSWQPLSPELRRALAACALFNGSFPLDGVEAVLEASGQLDGLDQLQELMNRMLLNRQPDGRLRLSLAVAEFALEALTQQEPSWLEQTRRRVLQWYSSLCGDLEVGAEAPPERYPRLMPELEGALTATRQGLERGDREAAAAVLLWALPMLHRMQRVRRYLHWIQRLGDFSDLPLPLVRRLGHSFTRLYFLGGQPEQALNIAQQVQRLCPDAHSDLLVLAAHLAQGAGHDELERHVQRADDVLTRPLPGPMEHLLYTALYTARWANTARRLDRCRDHLARAQRRGMAWACSDAHHLAASLLTYLSLPEEAERHVNAMRQPFDRAGLSCEGRYAGAMGGVRKKQGRLAEAEAYSRHALEMASEGGALPGVAWSSSILGTITGLRGDYAQSVRWFERSYQVADQMGEVRARALALANMGEVLRRQGRLVEARRTLLSAAEQFQDMGEALMASTPLRSLGRLELEAGEIEAARAALIQVLQLDTRAATLSLTHAVYSEVLAQLGDPEGMSLALRTLETARTKNRDEDLANVLYHCSRTAMINGHRAQACALALEAWELLRSLGLSEGAEVFIRVHAQLRTLGLEPRAERELATRH